MTMEMAFSSYLQSVNGSNLGCIKFFTELFLAAIRKLVPTLSFYVIATRGYKLVVMRLFSITVRILLVRLVSLLLLIMSRFDVLLIPFILPSVMKTGSRRSYSSAVLRIEMERFYSLIRIALIVFEFQLVNRKSLLCEFYLGFLSMREVAFCSSGGLSFSSIALLYLYVIDNTACSAVFPSLSRTCLCSCLS